MNLKWMMVWLGLLTLGFGGNVLGEETAKLPDDAEVRKLVTGTWAYAGTAATNVMKVNRQTYIFGPKGVLTKQLTYKIKDKDSVATTTGTWDVKDGAIVTTVIKTEYPGGEVKELKKPITLHMKVVSLTEHELVVRTEIAKALMTLKR